MSKNLILEKLEGVKERFEEVGRLLTSPDVMDDMKKYIQLNKEYKELSPVIAAYLEYKNTLSNIDSAKDILSTEKDDEMREMAKGELDELTNKIGEMESNLKILLLPADPQDTKNAILEIRAGTGGDEASIFAGDLFR
ncbi:MAG TPA: PCRF domain-containing protein, partial [Bacteroidales bacterium]|nr:PCRF domain-containing protein [Bacteroidales bacterium]